MKKRKLIILGCLILLILTAAGTYFFNKKNYVSQKPSPIQTITSSPKPSATPSTESKIYCLPVDLEAKISLDPGAGNVYGSLTIKNISKSTCRINGMDFILPTSSVKNITISKQGKSVASFFLLKPGETLYSQVHFPNGPQCSTETVATPVVFTYKISTAQSIQFSDDSGSKEQTVNSCKKESEKTEVQVWPLMHQPITVQ